MPGILRGPGSLASRVFDYLHAAKRVVCMIFVSFLSIVTFAFNIGKLNSNYGGTSKSGPKLLLIVKKKTGMNSF